MRSGLRGEVRSLGALGESSQGEMWKVNGREGDEEGRNPLVGVFRGRLPSWGNTWACWLAEAVSGACSPTRQSLAATTVPQPQLDSPSQMEQLFSKSQEGQ